MRTGEDAALQSMEEILPELDGQLRAAAAATRAATPPRPYVIVNMASTADGRASIGGRSGPIGDRADSELLHGLRTLVDALLVGAGTARAERYARILRGRSEREARLRRGLAAEPLTCIVSGSLDITPRSVPLLGERNARVAIVTSAAAGELNADGGAAGDLAASVAYVRAGGGELDLPGAFASLRAEHGVETLLCEGGPHLASQLLAGGLVDELFLSLAPKLAGGADGKLRITAGAELDPPAAMRLLSVHEHDSHLFLRYSVASERGPSASSGDGDLSASSAPG